MYGKSSTADSTDPAQMAQDLGDESVFGL